MSGSGGSGGDGWRPTPKPAPKKNTKDGEGGSGDGGGATPPDQCNITEDTILNSPNKAVIQTLNVGDILSINLNSGPPRVLEAMAGAEVAGSITSPSMSQIIECIDKDWQYDAVVLSVTGGRCQVRIQPQ